MRSVLWVRLPWVTITPFGRPLEPEVYWRKATDFGSGDGADQPAPAPSAIVSTASQGASWTSGIVRAAVSTAARIPAVVSTAAGCASSAMPASRSSPRARCAGWGRYAGTATTPAYRQPNSATTKSWPGWNGRSARDPGSTCAACRLAATARALASSIAKVSGGSASSPSGRKVNSGWSGMRAGGVDHRLVMHRFGRHSQPHSVPDRRLAPGAGRRAG